VPACPRAAIDLERNVTVLSDHAGHGSVWVACERAATQEAAQLACVHSIGLRELDRLSADGVRQMHILTGDCRACPRSRSGMPLAETLEAHQTLRRSHGQPHVVGNWPAPPAFDRTLARAREDHERIDRGRRRLFSAFVGAAAELTSAPLPGAPLAWNQPAIDRQRCVACDACVRHCPDGALQKREGERPAYVITPDKCSGCRLCVDICDRGAVSLTRLKSANLSEVSLDTGRCRACGVRYYSMHGTEAGGSGYCRICSETNHHKNLFQVFGDE
jgi:ferredoxin